MLAWLAGIALQLQQAALPPARAPHAMVAASVIVAVLAMVMQHRVASRWASRVAHALLCLGVATLAFATTVWRADARLAERLSPALEGRDLLVTGVIDRMPQLGPDGFRFALAVDGGTADGAAVALPPLLSLSWSLRQRLEPRLLGLWSESWLVRSSLVESWFWSSVPW